MRKVKDEYIMYGQKQQKKQPTTKEQVEILWRFKIRVFQENFSLSCELWVGTNDFNTKKNCLVRSNPRIIFLSGN
jgi:RNase P/RNase MRP subunit POP5